MTRPAALPVPPETSALGYTEECLSMACGEATLIGILTRPHQPSVLGVLVIVGGPQYRAGSHRQFVLLARSLGRRGHAVLRFDYRGMGDSDGPPRGFSEVSEDIEAALASFRQAMPGLRKIALWGLCDGASAALLYLDRYPASEVSGLCLLNPWVRSPQLLASARIKHYYSGRLMESSFWRKLVRGQVGLGRLAELAQHVRTMLGRPHPDNAGGGSAEGFRQRMARVWHQGRRPLLLVLSGRDLVAQEFLEAVARDPIWRRAMLRTGLSLLELPNADHTFSQVGASEAVEQATADWLERTLDQAAELPAPVIWRVRDKQR